MEKKKRRKRIKHTEAYKLKHRLARQKKAGGSNPLARLMVTPGMVAAMEQSLVAEATSRTAESPAVETPHPASKTRPFWIWVLLGLLIVALAGVIVARVLLG